MSRHRHLRSRAFTLIELLVVIVILGILMAVALPTFLRQQVKAQDSKAEQQLQFAYRAARGETADNGNLYPSVDSLVTDIRQSEPELTVSQGNCTQTASDRQIVEDSAISSSKHIYLYGKSSSGTIWRIDATPTGAANVTPLGSCSGPLATTTLASAANALSDTARASNAQGDGQPAISAYGAWEGTVNQIKYGGFENGASTGWGVYVGGGASATLSASQQQAKFGSWSLKVVTGGTAANEGTSSGAATRPAAAAGQTWAVSEWVNAPAGTGLEIGVEWFDASGIYMTGSYKPFTATGSWQHLQYQAVAPANTAYAGLLGIRTTSVEAATVYLDGMQLEQKYTATPYVEDSGANNIRNGADITVPATGVFSGSQGWVAMRISPGWPAATPPGGGSGFDAIFDWAVDSNNWIGVQYREGGQNWKIQRTGGGAPITQTNAAGASPGFTNAGDHLTVVAYWTATTIAISVNGQPFQTLAAANPTTAPMPATAELGSRGAGANSFCDCNIYWFAAGAGTLTDADAATINGWGDQDPTPQNFTAVAQAKETWSADDSTVVSG